MDKKLLELFEHNNGILRTKQLTSNGIYYKKIQTLLNRGEIIQPMRGYYQMSSHLNYSDVPLLVAMFPDAVLCMESALSHYGYTECTPSEWQLAVVSNTNRTRFNIDYPFVRPHFIEQNKFSIGITETVIDDCKIKIYDKERTICDILLHKNKIDAEIYNYAIKSYLKDEKKNIPRLMEYSVKLRVEKKVREVVGIWL